MTGRLRLSQCLFRSPRPEPVTVDLLPPSSGEERRPFRTSEGRLVLEFGLSALVDL
ncbi:hypothetical protein SAMN04490220_4495 [Rhodococcus jostii]|uniref:Uncharacterized protein n=1 Tax=Rhodococcus jostii TaxID=132919 RepID=A0A1H5APY7_RHOJO|nr:hypothetical protein SAMN04490220_4495 [Rhodococcus jostii]